MLWHWDWDWDDFNAVNFFSGGSDGVPVIAVSGDGDLGYVRVGSQHVFTIENPGGKDLVIPSITPPAGFTLVDPVVFPFTIGPGDSADFTLEATSVLVVAGNVSIVNNSEVSPYTFALSAEIYFQANFATDTLTDWENAATFSLVNVAHPSDGSLQVKRLTNNPTLGANLYASGKGNFDTNTESWVAQGTNTIARTLHPVTSNPELEITYNNNAEGAVQVLSATNDLGSNLVTGRWYEYQADARQSGGTGAGALRQRNFWGNVIHDHNLDTTMRTYKTAFIADTSGNHSIYGANMNAGKKIYIDNQTLREIDRTTIFLGCPTDARITGDVVVRGRVVYPSDFTTRPVGIFACLDSLTNPLNYVAAVVDRVCNLTTHFFKVVNGDPAMLFSVFGYMDFGTLSIRRSGNNFSFYRQSSSAGNTLIGTVAINDASIVNNSIHGILHTGGGSGGITDFSISKSLQATPLGFIGGSVTLIPSWADEYQRLETDRHMYRDVQIFRDAANGKTSIDHNFTNKAAVFDNNPRIIVIDHALNDQSSVATYLAFEEAEIRRARTLNPNAHIIIVTFPYHSQSVDANNKTISNQTKITELQALANYYDCLIWDARAYVHALVPSPYNLLRWYPPADFVHPLGTPRNGDYLYAVESLDPLISQAMLDGTAGMQWTGDLADYPRLYPASQYYEDSGTIVNAVDRTSETGTWTTVATTAKSSNVAGSSLSFTAVSSVFVVNFTKPSVGVVRWRIDGGAWTSVDLNNNVIFPQFLVDVGTPPASHTLDLEVVSGTVRVNDVRIQ
jgi:hypothetical protein